MLPLSLPLIVSAQFESLVRELSCPFTDPASCPMPGHEQRHVSFMLMRHVTPFPHSLPTNNMSALVSHMAYMQVKMACGSVPPAGAACSGA